MATERMYHIIVARGTHSAIDYLKWREENKLIYGIDCGSGEDHSAVVVARKLPGGKIKVVSVSHKDPCETHWHHISETKEAPVKIEVTADTPVRTTRCDSDNALAIVVEVGGEWIDAEHDRNA